MDISQNHIATSKIFILNSVIDEEDSYPTLIEFSGSSPKKTQKKKKSAKFKFDENFEHISDVEHVILHSTLI